jgi:pimeloyl-ACP methyl ester carboxylesterase
MPLLLFNYFSANLDDWDPEITNGLAAEHDVVIFDYPGVGRSSGETPSTVTELVKYTYAFCQALDLKRINAIGFSLGGMIVQELAAGHPELLNRIILLGTGPRGGEGMRQLKRRAFLQHHFGDTCYLLHKVSPFWTIFQNQPIRPQASA